MGRSADLNRNQGAGFPGIKIGTGRLDLEVSSDKIDLFTQGFGGTEGILHQVPDEAG
jgi:hypothetical protein